MTEYDYWKIFPRMPKKVMIGDITIRDGFQHEERFISTPAKIFYGEEVLTHFRGDRFKMWCVQRQINYDDIIFSAVTIREIAMDRAVELRKEGVGPDRVLMMVSTDPEHHFANSGITLIPVSRDL